jgi:hypothetical protein
MSYGQIPLRKANEISTVTHVEVKAIKADFNVWHIAASFIKNYKALINSVVH